MLDAAARAFVSMGAVVSVSATGENLVRRRAVPLTGVEVQAQGLPNLLHELVHALLAGRLDDDHGFDYAKIPYDLASGPGRAVLWDELAACALSCTYLRASLCHHPDREIGAEEIDAIADAWFVEQVEIQPVFYGMEDDPPAFVAAVGALLRAHAQEADAFVAHAQARLARALTEAGAESKLAEPGPCESLAAIWARTMQASSPAQTEAQTEAMTEAMTEGADRRRLRAAPG